MTALTRFFDLKGRGTNFATEARGAVATFLTMAYILFANASILQNAGIPFEAVVAGTALAAGVCCILMGLVANFPLALASGMGLNVLVAFQITQATGSWQTAMGIVVLDGLLILVLVLTGLREAVMDAIPLDLRRAIGAGIGLFIAFIGLVNAGFVVPGVEGGPPVSYGNLREPSTLVAALGLLITAFLLARRITGALVLGILAGTVLGLALGVTKLPAQLGFPRFDTLFQANVVGALKLEYLPLLFALLMVDFFDTLGTVSAIAEQSGLQDGKGRIPNIRRILVIDSLSASIGGLFGASSATAYIESASGVSEGARTGLHTVLVGLLFLAAVFLAPVAGVVPAAATAPALILVGFLMVAQITRINFLEPTVAIPAFLTLLLIPLTYSISHGIGYGFIAYVALQVLNGKAKAVRPLMYVVAAAFLAFFLWPGG